jgi:hypothetical protein
LKSFSHVFNNKIMFRKIIIFIPLLLFIILLVIVSIRIGKSISPLRELTFNVEKKGTLPSSAGITLLSPLISDSGRIFCLADIRIAGVQQFSLCKIMSDQSTADLVHVFDSADLSIAGYAISDNHRHIYLKHKANSFSFLSIINDSVYRAIVAPETGNEKIISISASGQYPEFITLSDSLQVFFKKYTYNPRKEIAWEVRQQRPNAFFMRISKPVAAYQYRNNWFFMATSPYFRRDSLYVNVPAGTTNVMLFRNNLSYHFDDIRIQESSFTEDILDYTFSGVFETDTECIEKFTYNPNITEFIRMECPGEEIREVPIYLVQEYQNTKFPFYKYSGENEKMYLTSIDGQNISFTIEKNSKTGRTVFSNSQSKEPFAITSSAFQEIFLIPFNNSFLFLLDNGQFCILNDHADRLDHVNYNRKVSSFIKSHFTNLIEHSGKLQSFTMPVMLLGYPFIILFTLFIFFIISVFLTPKRPAYSSRRKKKTPLISYIIPASFLYLIAVFAFFYNFLSLLKTV